MSVLGADGLQDIVRGNFALQSGEQIRSSILPPLSRELRVDENLKLSQENFKQTINAMFNYKDVTSLSQLTAKPHFPTHHLLAQFASKAYTDYKTGETDAQYETRLALSDGWKLLTTASNSSLTNGYFGAAYWHPERQQVVIAHRGTELTNVGALLTDVVGVFFKHCVPQMESASTFTHKVVEVLREVSGKKGVTFQLFYTGHSLGGWLAQITTFTTKYLKTEGNMFLKNNNDQSCYHPHTVVFDSPGCKDMLSKMTSKFDVRLDGRSIELKHLDITSYLSAPNRINTCDEHVGTVYRIFTDLSDTVRLTRSPDTPYHCFTDPSGTVWLTGLISILCRIFPDLSPMVFLAGLTGIVYNFFTCLPHMGWQIKRPVLYTSATHSIKKVVQAFDPQTGQVCTDDEGKPKVQVVVDWPISTGLGGGEEYKKFFEWAEQFRNYHPDITDEYFQYSPIRYQTKLYDERLNSLSVFSQEEQEFLKDYRTLRQWQEFCKPKELFCVMGDNEASEVAGKILHSFEIESDTVSCTEATTLQDLIPYVKRLLHLYPEIKEIKNSVLQCETRSCVQRISQSPLEFNTDGSDLREFIESEQQKVLHLRMAKGDEWTGLIKVHQVLKKAGCLIERQYTVLKFESLLTLNKLLDFSSLRLSSEAPYLMMVACEATDHLKEETKDTIRAYFETMKQKPLIKLILTSPSDDKAVPFLQDTIREIFGNGFVTKDEQLTWHDLTSSSQVKLLKKSVKFQDAKISLNKLMSAECPVAEFLPLGDLLAERGLNIVDPVPDSNGYNENYYIGRTFHIQKVIEQGIYSEKKVNEGQVFLASTEKEFKQLCQLYPNSNVHWVEKDISGKLVWQQSRGSLETVSRYIDTDSSHTYTDGGLVKLLEQAEQQRVMLISATAGMGKSTVLTHLSKIIKQKFPSNWVVRIDLNDHTDALKGLEQEQINKEKATEFVSEIMLKLKPGLDLELFKLCCEQKEKVRIVIMLDGFDEISPFYKQTVIDILQALRQTAVEQLWVTTRPHLRKELEDKLQQLSYTLEPFSEENQIEFLTKSWNLNDWFTEMDIEVTEESKTNLEIYAKKLIKKLSNSISDKDRKFCGISLQIRMLAEAFDEEVKKFCQSVESMTELEFQLDLLELYERFIERKYDIYQEEKFQVQVDKVFAKEQRESDLKIMRNDHQLLALKVLFTQEQLATFEINSQCTFPVEKLERFGIVQISHDVKPLFIHRTFAEYYVADYLVNCLTEGNNASQQLQTFILKDIFLEDDYRVIRVFVDGLLVRYKPSNQMLKQYGTRIDDLRNDCLLHRAAFEGNANITDFLIDSARAGGHKDTASRLLIGHDTRKRTAWYVAAKCGELNVLQKIWDLAKDNLTTEDIKNKLLLATDSDGNTAWQRAAKWGKPDVLQKIWDFAKENLTREEIKNKLLLTMDSDRNTTWQRAALWGNLELFKKILDWAEDSLTKEEKRVKLLLTTDSKGNTTWHLAAKRSKLNLLQKIWDMAKENLTKDEINNIMLLATDSDGNTAWHRTAFWGNLDLFQKIMHWAKNNLTKEEIKVNMLLATDSKGSTAWHLAAKRGKLELLQNIWDFAKDSLTPEEIKNKMLLATDSDGNTAWHSAAFWGNLDTLKKTQDWAKENLTKEEIKIKLLLATDNDKNTAWHRAACCGKLDVLQKIWDMAKDNLTKKEIKYKLLLATDSGEKSALERAAEGGNPHLLQKIWHWTKDSLTTEDIKNKFLLATDSDGNTAWHRAADSGKPGVLQKIRDLAKEILTTEEIKNKLLLSTNFKGITAWHRAVNSGKLDILQEIWDLAIEILTKEEIKYKMLLATDSDGNTAWHRASLWDNLDLFKKIVDWAKNNLTNEEIKINMLLVTDSKGNTAWHLAAKRGKLELLQNIWDFAKDSLTPEEIKNKMLLETDRDGNTALHKAAFWGKPDLLQKIWVLAKEFLTTEAIKNELLLATNSDGNTTWHMAAERTKPDVLQKIWHLAKENLTTEDIRYKLLLTADGEGRTALHRAAEGGNLTVLQTIWDLAKENLTREEIKSKILLSTGSNGNTAWHRAASCGKPDILQKIWVLAKEILTSEDIKNKLLLATDSDGNTAWHRAAESGKLDVLQKVWDLGKGYLTTEEIKYKLLLAADNDGNTAWHRAAFWGNLGVFKKIMDWAKDNLTEEETKLNLLLAINTKGNSTWNRAACRGKLDVLQKIWDMAKDNLTTEEIKYKLLATDNDRNTAWHRAALWGNLNLFQKILDWAKDNLTKEGEKIDFLLATDSKGYTAWHWAAAVGNLSVLQKIWNLAKDNLTTEEIKNVLLATDIDGNTAWHRAALWGNLDLFQKILDWAKDNLTKEGEKFDFLLATDSKGYTALHWAKVVGNPSVLQKICDFARDNLTTEEKKIIFSHRQ